MERVGILANQFGIGEALPADSGHGQHEAIGIGQRVVFGLAGVVAGR